MDQLYEILKGKPEYKKYIRNRARASILGLFFSVSMLIACIVIGDLTIGIAIILYPLLALFIWASFISIRGVLSKPASIAEGKIINVKIGNRGDDNVPFIEEYLVFDGEDEIWAVDLSDYAKIQKCNIGDKVVIFKSSKMDKPLIVKNV